MKRNTTQPPMLPGMGKPAFGGVQLRPGMEIKRPYTGPQRGFFDQLESDLAQATLPELPRTVTVP